MTEHTRLRSSRRTMVAIALLLIAAISAFVISEAVSAPAFSASTIASLDEKKDTVMKLAVAAAASSTVITLIPGDTAMPIADEIAELSSYFILILSAILLEKMLVTVVGYVSFTYIIPFACLLGVAYLYLQKDFLLSIAIKLAIFGVILFLAIPASIKVSEMIDASYQESIAQALETVEVNSGYIEENSSTAATEEENLIGKIGDYLSDAVAKIENNLSDMVHKGEEMLAAFMDAIAVLIITSCVVPLVVILIFVWVIKILFGFDIKGYGHSDKNLK